MQRITIGRYGHVPADIPRSDDHPMAQDLYAGWIEGTRDDGTDWVLFLDKDGNPSVYWPHRAEGGGVLGEPVQLGVG